MSRELTLEEAENIVNNMYQNRWKECCVEDDNTIHIRNLDNLQYNELESASILLLITEIRLQQENKKYKEVIDKSIDKLESLRDFIRNESDYIVGASEIIVNITTIINILKEVK